MGVTIYWLGPVFRIRIELLYLSPDLDRPKIQKHNLDPIGLLMDRSGFGLLKSGSGSGLEKNPDPSGSRSETLIGVMVYLDYIVNCLKKKPLYLFREKATIARFFLPSNFFGGKNLNFYPSLTYLWLIACAAHLPITVQMNSCLYEIAFSLVTRLPMKMYSWYPNSSLPGVHQHRSIIFCMYTRLDWF